MRIIGEVSHPVYKITAFSSHGKVSLKIEDGLLEQTLKFRDGTGIESIEDIRKFCSKEFLEVVGTNFKALQKSKVDALVAMNSEDDAFDIII